MCRLKRVATDLASAPSMLFAKAPTFKVSESLAHTQDARIRSLSTGITFALPESSNTAIAEKVVPRSMPMMFFMCYEVVLVLLRVKKLTPFLPFPEQVVEARSGKE